MKTIPSALPETPRLGEGIYTLADASRLLQIAPAKMRSWVSGYLGATDRSYPASGFRSRGAGRAKTFSFLTLVEIFIVAQLRKAGLSMRSIRVAREELAKEFKTDHPFALKGILSDGKLILKSLEKDRLLELGSGGMQSFESIVAPFCQRLDFDKLTHLAERFYPDGRESSVIVDPLHSFGRPIIEETNITTAMLASLIRGGDSIAEVSMNYDLKPRQVEEAWEFEQRIAA